MDLHSLQEREDCMSKYSRGIMRMVERRMLRLSSNFADIFGMLKNGSPSYASQLERRWTAACSTDLLLKGFVRIGRSDMYLAVGFGYLWSFVEAPTGQISQVYLRR